MYTSLISNNKAVLPEVRYHYIDYASMQNLTLTKVDISEHVSFWRDTLSAHIQPLEIPTDKARPPVMTTNGSSLTTYMNRNILNKLLKLGKSTAFSSLFAAYFILLYRYSGQKDIIVGVPLSLRDVEGVADIIGYTVNTVPVLINLTSDLSFKNILQRVQSAMIQCYKHQNLPFSLLVENLKLPRDASR